MPRDLTPEQIEALRSKAEERGIDPEKLIARARVRGEAKPRAEESVESKPSAPDTGVSGAAADPPKVFQYHHLPFTRVREIRKQIGLTEDIDDQDLPAGEWLVLHGGALTPSAGGTGQPA